MSHASMIISVLMTMAMLVFLAPGVFALNRGHVLRNIALWLAIFLGLTLFYQNFGPDSQHPLFRMPDSMVGMNKSEALKFPLLDGDKDKPDVDQGEEGYVPPKEE